MAKKQQKEQKDRYASEVLTDNTKIEYCRNCKDCKFRMSGKDGYKKVYCDIFEAPEFKYSSIINNGDCDFYSKEN